jgi:hypothetical protein
MDTKWTPNQTAKGAVSVRGKKLSDFPHLVAEWHPTKNGDKSPEDVGAGTSAKLWWKCSHEHEWRAEGGKRSQSGYGCPFCSGRFAILGKTDMATTHPNLASQFDLSRNYPFTPESLKAGTNKKLWWKCSEGHSWIAEGGSRVQGYGCKACAGQLAVSGKTDMATTHPNLASQFDLSRNYPFTPESLKAGTHKKLWWRCRENHEWSSRGFDRSRGVGCPFCEHRTALSGETDMATTHPHLALEFDYEENFPLTPEDIMSGGRRRLFWKCLKGHEWSARSFQRLNGSGCPFCSRNEIVVGETDMATTHPDLVAEFNRIKNFPLAPEALMSGTNKRLWWTCADGHEWITSGNNRANGSGCPTCALSGFSPNSPGYLYLLRNDVAGLRKLGITNDPERRFTELARCGFDPIEVQGPFANGQQALDWEQAILRFLRSSGAVFACDFLMDQFDGWTESWLANSSPVLSIKELKSLILNIGKEMDLAC